MIHIDNLNGIFLAVALNGCEMWHPEKARFFVDYNRFFIKIIVFIFNV